MILNMPMMVGNIPERKKAAMWLISSFIRENLTKRINLATSNVNTSEGCIQRSHIDMPLKVTACCPQLLLGHAHFGLHLTSDQAAFRKRIIFTDFPNLAASVPWTNAGPSAEPVRIEKFQLEVPSEAKPIHFQDRRGPTSLSIPESFKNLQTQSVSCAKSTMFFHKFLLMHSKSGD